MTGNVIFLGIAAISRDWGEIIPHLVSTCGFFSGVLCSKHMRSRLSERFVLLLGLAFESMALFALGWLPGNFPHMAFNGHHRNRLRLPGRQYRRVERFSYNSTFVTGNLHDTAEGIYGATLRTATPEVREEGRAKALDLGLICLCFLCGAILGAWAAPRFGNYSLWLTEPFLLTVALRSFRSSFPLSPPSPTK